MVRVVTDARRPADSGLTAPPELEARQCLVRGVVQGVGFRPYVHRLAVAHGLTGWVRNDAGEVTIHLEGAPGSLEAFLHALPVEVPPLAQIAEVVVEERAPAGHAAFAVLTSGAVDHARRVAVPPDVALCEACLAELSDPLNRRYRYPFITCTDCGPRFTLIDDVPYARARTAMAVFPMCPACEAEYHDPASRRFHAETNCCPACGPRLWLERGSGRSDGDAAITAAAAMLRAGEIVALRGIGGFHLAVDATNPAAVARLRSRKHREAKPLAIMVRSAADAALIAVFGTAERELLERPERPVVLLPARPGTLAAGVHPGLDRVGVMLAYTPLHHLLLASVERPLVMTSGNCAEEPIAAGLDEARRRLGTIADGLLMHDRDIRARCDDSVVRSDPSGPVFLRRARGYAPLPVPLPVSAPVPILAVGPHLKNTATLAHGAQAFVTPHVGDLESVESLAHFRHLLAAYARLFHITPAIVAHDLHPGYLSTRLAEETGLPRFPVQHHHAHVAAVLAEHGVTDSAVGLACDGTGYGVDGTVWGCEFFVASLTEATRVGHLRAAPLPGGDLAARQPWRAALGYQTLDPALTPSFVRAYRDVSAAEVALAEAQARRGVNAPMASSLGRLFDAASAILGLRAVSAFEGQAAMELEALAGRRPGTLLPFPVIEMEGRWVLDPLPLLGSLGERRLAGDDPADLAASFHDSVAAGLARVTRWAASVAGRSTVALGGGSFQNGRLLHALRARLRSGRLRVLTPQRLGPNDGSISYGQAAVAAATLARDSGT